MLQFYSWTCGTDVGTFSASRDAGDGVTMLPKFKQGRGASPGQIVTVGSPFVYLSAQITSAEANTSDII